MVNTKQYNMYHLAYSLIKQDNFEIIHMNVKENEIWLEKVEGKISKVVRFIQKGFDWKNHLKLDIATVFQRVKGVKQFLRKNNIEIYNVYITEHEPVDSWETLKRPIQLKEKRPLKMNVYYLSEDNMQTERYRLLKQINSNIENDFKEPVASEQKVFVELYKMKLYSDLQHKNEQLQSLFTQGKPRFIYGIIFVHLLLYYLFTINDGHYLQQFMQFLSASEDEIQIIHGMFYHFNIFHVLINMILLFFIGSLVERVYGSTRLLFIYTISFIGITILAHSFHVNMGAGASIISISFIGALFVFVLFYRHLFFETIGKNLIFLLMLTITLTLIIPSLHLIPHLIGFSYGIIVACIVYFPNKSKRHIQLMAGLIFLISLIVSIVFRMQ